MSVEGGGGEERDRGEERDARGQTIEAVDEVEGVAHPDEPEDGQRQREVTQQYHVTEGVCQRSDLESVVVEIDGRQELYEHLGPRRDAHEVVDEPDEGHRAAGDQEMQVPVVHAEAVREGLRHDQDEDAEAERERCVDRQSADPRHRRRVQLPPSVGPIEPAATRGEPRDHRREHEGAHEAEHQYRQRGGDHGTSSACTP